MSKRSSIVKLDMLSQSAPREDPIRAKNKIMVLMSQLGERKMMKRIQQYVKENRKRNAISDIYRLKFQDPLHKKIFMLSLILELCIFPFHVIYPRVEWPSSQ